MNLVTSLLQGGSVDVQIALDRTHVRPGETVNGYVELTAPADFSCSEVSVTFRGIARSSVLYTERKQQYDGGISNQGLYNYDSPDQMQGFAASQRMSVESRNVCCLHMPLARFPSSTVPAGLYQFHFQLPVPTGIPSSVPQLRGTGSMASISYFVTVKVSCPGFTSDVVREVPLDVAEALGQARVEDPQPQLASDTQTVQWCCCFDSGSVTLVGMIQTPTLVQGQPFDLSWQLSNDTTGQVTRVKAKLVQKLLIGARGSRKSTQEILQEEVAMECIAPGGRPGYGPESTRGEFSTSDMLVCRLSAPTDAKTSVSVPGMLEVEHVLVIEAETGFCASNPHVKLPVRLLREAPIPAESWDTEGQGGVAFGLPVAYRPNPEAKTSPHQVPVDGWVVVNDTDEPMGPLHGFAGYGASASGYI